MKSPFLATLIGMAPLLWTPGVSSQTVYRCGPEGRTYSQAPCTAGQVVDVSDTRSDAQRREARQVMQRQEDLGRVLEDERRDRESRPGGASTLVGAKVGSGPQATPSSTPKGRAKASKPKKTRKQANGAEQRTVVVAPAKPRKSARPKG